ncbi:CCD81 protein, partial [Urocolius indicus]|nr:CCD81 protein [Urocolius indicus]
QGVLVKGLGIFAVVREKLWGKEVEYVIQRPVFQLDADLSRLLNVKDPQENIFDDVEVEPLNYKWLLRATSFPLHVVEGFVEETILLYALQLWAGQNRPFIFKNIGVLSSTQGFLCLHFYRSCVEALEKRETILTLLHT